MRQTSIRPATPYQIFMLLLLVVGLSACGGRGMTDLEKEVKEIKARKNPHIDPLPSFQVIPNYFYEVEDMRDPFKTLMDTRARDIQMTTIGDTANDKQCQKPDPYRIRVGLELMPLDALEMVGTLEDAEGTLWGLVASKNDGTTYRVQVGDYIGENDGQIINISPTKIELMELYPDGSGCYVEQTASIALSE